MLAKAKTGLALAVSLRILRGSAGLLVYGVGHIFRGIPDEFEEPVVLGFIVDDDGATVDLAAHADDISTYHGRVRACQASGAAGVNPRIRTDRVRRRIRGVGVAALRC